MSRPFQNPYLDRQVKSFQRKTTTVRAQAQADTEMEKKIAEEVGWTLNVGTGRARYSLKSPNGETILHCIQKVSRLPWWRKLLVPLIGRYCEIAGVKYLKVGETNIFYRAQEWITGRARKSILRMK